MSNYGYKKKNQSRSYLNHLVLGTHGRTNTKAERVLYNIKAQVSATNEHHQDSINKFLQFKQIKLKCQIHSS